MNYKKSFEKLLEDNVFKGFKKEHQDIYLTHFYINEKAKTKTNWQIGFFSEKDENIYVFEVSLDEVKLVAKDKAFNKETNDIGKLDLEKVDLSKLIAQKVSDKLYNDKYGSDPVTSRIFILQNIDNIMVWNVTYMTMSFKLVNIRVNAQDGKIIEDTVNSLLNWRQ